MAIDGPVVALATAERIGLLLVTLLVAIALDRARAVGGAISAARQAWNDPYAEQDPA